MRNTPMIQIQRILCPIDFSDFSRRSLDQAVAIAHWYESTITVLHVTPLVPTPAYAPSASALPAAAVMGENRATILEAMKRFTAGPAGTGVPMESEVAEGLPAAEILAKADALPADLLVMGTHGRSGFEQLVLGSVAEKVLRKAVCPVLTVPQGGSDAQQAPAVFKRIVCAVDFSDCSMRGLEYAMSLAQEADATLTLVHVIELPPAVPREPHEIPVTIPLNLREYIAHAEQDARARLDGAIPDAVRANCTVDTVLATGKPYREILRVAEEHKADLLVVGIHGRGAIDRLLFGSTAQHLVRQSSCPVLTLRKG
jgi:nucleotide-binding universal stress UspA family protein